METVTILRELWRRRTLVLGVAIVALLVGLSVMFKPGFPPQARQYQVGVATTSILLDTPSSQVVDVAPRGSGTLGARANVLASVMVDGAAKAAIAQSAGLNPSDLVGVSKTGTDTPVTTSASPNDSRAATLTTQVLTDNENNPLPIIQVQAQAPNAADAQRLANAAVVGLRNYLSTKAATERIPDAQRLQVSGLGVSQAHTTSRGPSNVLALAVVILVFVLGCAGILGVLALIRNWRAADAREAWAGEDLPFGLVDDLSADDAALVGPSLTNGASDRHGRADDWGDDWLAPDHASLVTARPGNGYGSVGDDDPGARNA